MRELRIGVRKVQPVLVVCHSSVLCNWKEELNTWDTSLCSDRGGFGQEWKEGGCVDHI